MRYQQIREAVIKLHTNRGAWQMPIFQAMAPKLLSDLRDTELWHYIKERTFNFRGGRHIIMCRFMASVEGAERCIQRWHVDTYETMLAGMEGGLREGLDEAGGG